MIRLPIAHAEGNYFADEETLDRLEEEGRVVFRYCDEAGEATAEANPNGAQRNIAGICDETGRILGLMPHPERLFELALGGADGRRMIESALLSALEAGLSSLPISQHKEKACRTPLSGTPKPLAEAAVFLALRRRVGDLLQRLDRHGGGTGGAVNCSSLPSPVSKRACLPASMAARNAPASAASDSSPLISSPTTSVSWHTPLSARK